jgi:hypothetical protein
MRSAGRTQGGIYLDIAETAGSPIAKAYGSVGTGVAEGDKFACRDADFYQLALFVAGVVDGVGHGFFVCRVRKVRDPGGLRPIRAAASRKAGGHRSSAGSGQRAAQITARHAANGRLAHQMCSVEMCPCRMDFSRRACAEISLIGRSTSISRFEYFEVFGLVIRDHRTGVMDGGGACFSHQGYVSLYAKPAPWRIAYAPWRIGDA